MLVAVIGPPASASTWVYNVVRAILAETHPGAVGLYVEHGQGLFDNIPLGVRNIVIKSHAADAALLKFLNISGARIIMTDRDPRDCTVSQQERFNLRPRDVVREIARSYATMATLLMHTQPLQLHYQDRFFATSQTLYQLREWLGVSISDMKLEAIFEAFHADTVRPKLQKWLSDLTEGGPVSINTIEHHDHTTHFHPGHIGDGMCGKAKDRLPAAAYKAVSECFDGFGHANQWHSKNVIWCSSFFDYPDERWPGASEWLDLCGEERLLVYGPYMFLPTGHWRVVLKLRPECADVPVRLNADVFTVRRGLLEFRVITLPASRESRTVLEFEHVDHADALEVRFSSIADGNQSRVHFAGATLTWLGPCGPQPGMSARRVDHPGILQQT